MTKSITLLLLAGCLGAGGMLAQALQNATATQVPQNPNYSAAVFSNEDPVAYLQRFEAQWNAAPSPRAGLRVPAYAAKAALEAGDNQKAYNYAIQTLSIADDAASDRQRRGFKNPRRFEGIPTADYYGNFVLGRLALLSGDIRSAEQYLIASGKTFGDAVLRSYGPNMSLAYELLKRGDHQSWQAVLTFLDEIKVFWAHQSRAFCRLVRGDLLREDTELPSRRPEPLLLKIATELLPCPERGDA